MPADPQISEYLKSLKASKKYGPQVIAHREIPASPPVFSTSDEKTGKKIRHILDAIGVKRLYSHQEEAIAAVRKKQDVLVCTPTASGKSMIYNLPVLAGILDDPKVKALYLFPLKALAQDQKRVFDEIYTSISRAFRIHENRPAEIFDGDTSRYQRSRIRKSIPPVLMTNPDMLHLSILPYHDSWSLFFKNLKYVIIDEVHTYRGVFGAHMSWVLRRLLRIASYYGSRPVFIMLSATIGNPSRFGASLIGSKVKVVRESGAPSPLKHVVMMNPWDSAAYAASQLLEAALSRDLRTIVYTKSRKMTELISLWTTARVQKKNKKLSAYRAGFLPEERREIEQSLASGKLHGVISTSALELGIDIGNLDLCILVGYPGSIMATRQRGGRVGRGNREAAVIFIGGEDALDQYFMRNPGDFFAREPEQAALNPYNKRIVRQHLHCAAAEIPIDLKEQIVLESNHISESINDLVNSSELLLNREGTFLIATRKRPHRQVSLRGGGTQLSIIDITSGEIIGEIDSGRALKETHGGAVYIHHASMLMVTSLDLAGKEVLVEEKKLPYYTRPSVEKNTEILSTLYSRSVFGCRVSFGNLKVREKVTGYKKINSYTGKTISSKDLDLPEQIIETEGIWIDIPDQQRKRLEDEQKHFMGAIHAIEHAMIAMFPLMILCDRNDIGGISCPQHEQTGGSSVFIYDGYSGGAGLCHEAYNIIEDLLKKTTEVIDNCECETGCPSCVHSPKCGSGNRPIDKAASLILLQRIIASDAPDIKCDWAPFDTGVKNSRPYEPRSVDNSGITVNEAMPDTVSSRIEEVLLDYCVFDLETKYSAAEVGGWSRADKMGISAAVVYDSKADGYISYLEDEIPRMIEHLSSFRLVIGFNNKRFDNRVLSAYTNFDLFTLPSLDILEEVHAQLGYRLSLNRLAECTLGCSKSGDGLKALQWYKEGKLGEIVKYCRKDVEITRNLFLHELEKGFLLFRNKAGSIVRLPLGLKTKSISVYDEESG